MSLFINTKLYFLSTWNCWKDISLSKLTVSYFWTDFISIHSTFILIPSMCLPCISTRCSPFFFIFFHFLKISMNIILLAYTLDCMNFIESVWLIVHLAHLFWSDITDWSRTFVEYLPLPREFQLMGVHFIDKGKKGSHQFLGIKQIIIPKGPLKSYKFFKIDWQLTVTFYKNKIIFLHTVEGDNFFWDTVF